MRTGSYCRLVTQLQVTVSLSGLAQAFFYAGARSLVVSHWDVLDHETALLMSDVFKGSSQNKLVSHGEA